MFRLLGRVDIYTTGDTVPLGDLFQSKAGLSGPLDHLVLRGLLGLRVLLDCRAVPLVVHLVPLRVANLLVVPCPGFDNCPTVRAPHYQVHPVARQAVRYLHQDRPRAWLPPTDRDRL